MFSGLNGKRDKSELGPRRPVGEEGVLPLILVLQIAVLSYRELLLVSFCGAVVRLLVLDF